MKIEYNHPSIQELDYYDGPIMLAGQTSTGDWFIATWIDSRESEHYETRIFLVALITKSKIQHILNNNCTLYEAYRFANRTGTRYLWDFTIWGTPPTPDTEELQPITFEQCQKEDWIPRPGNYYNQMMKYQNRRLWISAKHRFRKCNNRGGRHKDSLRRFHKQPYFARAKRIRSK